MAHEHGPHKCYCPNCDYEVEVTESVKCNTVSCPRCGARMRAKETGEFRKSASSIAIGAKVLADSIPCPVCGYPIPAPSQVGEQVKCAYCHNISEAIEQGITVPTSLFVGMLCFAGGVILGPALLATTKSGSEWLAKQARVHLK